MNSNLFMQVEVSKAAPAHAACTVTVRLDTCNSVTSLGLAQDSPLEFNRVTLTFPRSCICLKTTQRTQSGRLETALCFAGRTVLPMHNHSASRSSYCILNAKTGTHEFKLDCFSCTKLDCFSCTKCFFHAHSYVTT